MTQILVINCGSSSIKYALVSSETTTRIAGLAENLGTAQARLSGRDAQQQKFTVELGQADHAQALQAIIAQLQHPQLDAIGHRVVHGGTITAAQRITPELIEQIEQMSTLAPLHNPPALVGIRAALDLFEDVPQVAVFDTAFHQSMPAHAYRYALPKTLYTEHGVRRYGFHGTSHAYVSERASTLTGQTNQGGWLVAHLGNGCSTCAVWNGQSLDTSMGLTPLEGVCMGTRSGDVDPGLHLFLANQLDWDIATIDRVLNRESGLLGLSGLSNDMRTLIDAAEQGHQDAALAIEVFVYRLAKSLAALSCALPQLDGLIFTGGIGENAALIRQKIIAALPHFGLRLDEEKNQQARGRDCRIDADSSPQIWVIATDEEGRIASETAQVAELHH